MGQEWAATAPFLFFTDHDEELGRLVNEGRRREFRDYAAFADPAQLDTIPDPQAEATFLACKLDWSERDREPHASTLRLYRALLQLRRAEPALRAASRESFEAVDLDADSLALRRDAETGLASLWLVVRFKGPGTASLAGQPSALGRRWELVLTTEDPPFSPDASPPDIDLAGPAPVVRFTRPGAVLLRAHAEQAELKLILEQVAQAASAKPSREEYRALADRVRAALGDRLQADSAALLAEDRER